MNSQKTVLKALSALSLVVVAGCEQPVGNPVIFGQTHTLGVSIGQDPATQTPEFSLGYSDANIAYLPTIAKDDHGNIIELGGESKSKDSSFHETYSVLGQFSAESPTTTGADNKFVLGKFFATGLAAQKLSAGFACALSDGKDSAHCHKPGATPATGGT